MIKYWIAYIKDVVNRILFINQMPIWVDQFIGRYLYSMRATCGFSRRQQCTVDVPEYDWAAEDLCHTSGVHGKCRRSFSKLKLRKTKLRSLCSGEFGRTSFTGHWEGHSNKAQESHWHLSGHGQQKFADYKVQVNATLWCVPSLPHSLSFEHQANCRHSAVTKFTTSQGWVSCMGAKITMVCVYVCAACVLARQIT